MAGRNFEISDWERVKRIANGARLRAQSIRNAKTLHHKDEPIPEFYDFRQAYPECNSIQDIYDQANCGSCWSFCAVEAMSDRLCIHSKQKINVAVSAQDALSCCGPKCGNCVMGDPMAVYDMWAATGITTGGHYNKTEEGCKPYFLPECGSNCPSTTATVPACEKTCADTSLDFEKQLTFGESDVYIFREAKQIQLEMLKNGPVSTVFLVPADFPSYQSGIYQMTTEVIVGSHCLKLVGWGVEDGIKYWIVANSWGKKWGENGYFRIIRGRNESGIEGAAISAMPKLDLSFVHN